MTISIWRYSHLALAVSSFIFLALASVTGIILAYNAVDEKIPSYNVQGFNNIKLSESIPALKKVYPEITSLSVDEKKFITLEGFNENGDATEAYIHPLTGKILGIPKKQTPFMQWVTELHRSLFLHSTGRFFIGLTAFLLTLITLSGIILVIKRQQGFRRFFTKVIKENFAQYYHVTLGRLSLIPILIIALTGTYLSLVRLGIFPEKKISHNFTLNEDVTGKAKAPEDIAVFKQVLLSEIKTIEFPFADDPEEYYTLKMKDREIVVDQFTGEKISEIKYPFTTLLANLSLNLHTGRTNILWAIILAMAAFNILFFIYSGFAITFKRTSGKIKNKHKANESEFILLAGSENGSTLGFARAIHQQLLAAGHSSYLTELNNYTVFTKAKHLIIFTSTYGTGEAPANARKLMQLVKKHPQNHKIHTSVVGFGSVAYENFCGFAYQVQELFDAESWCEPFLNIHTVNDKSAEQFALWIQAWSKKAHIPLTASPALFNRKPSGLQAMFITQKTPVANTCNIFTVTLRLKGRIKFSSGDLLAIYPANDNRERFYSIGKINNDIQLIVKLHTNGLGSDYLYQLTTGTSIYARVVRNVSFHFPTKAPAVAMIANGTGIAPFLGMIAQNKKTDCYLYVGLRTPYSLAAEHQHVIAENIQQGKLKNYHVAYSQTGNKEYVYTLIAHDAAFFAQLLSSGGVIMLCGSLSMQKDVLKVLEIIAADKTRKTLDFYKEKGQILTDCY